MSLVLPNAGDRPHHFGRYVREMSSSLSFSSTAIVNENYSIGTSTAVRGIDHFLRGRGLSPRFLGHRPSYPLLLSSSALPRSEPMRPEERQGHTTRTAGLYCPSSRPHETRRGNRTESERSTSARQRPAEPSGPAGRYTDGAADGSGTAPAPRPGPSAASAAGESASPAPSGSPPTRQWRACPWWW